MIKNARKGDFRELKSEKFPGEAFPQTPVSLRRSFRKSVSIYPRSAPASPNSMLLPTNAQGSGFLLNTQQHCFQGKGEREEPVQLRFLEKCCASIQFSQQFCPRLWLDCKNTVHAKLKCRLYCQCMILSYFLFALTLFYVAGVEKHITNFDSP